MRLSARASLQVLQVEYSVSSWTDVIDTLTTYPDARRKVIRVLAEIDAAGLEGSSRNIPQHWRT